MKQNIGIIASSHIDKHGDKMSLSALESIVEQVNKYVIPVGIEHDPRIPPKGRISSAQIIKLDDGEYAVEAVFEFFEPNDAIVLSNTSKIMRPNKFDIANFNIIYDRNFRYDEDLRLINDIAVLFETEAREQLKKAVDPLSVLIIVASFIIGSIAKGFLGKFGEDGYLLLKDRIKKLMTRKKEGEIEKILKLQMYIQIDKQVIEVDVILTNPTTKEIDSFFDEEFMRLDDLVTNFYEPNIDLYRMVFEYRKGEVVIKYSIRKDGFPMTHSSSILNEDDEGEL